MIELLSSIFYLLSLLSLGSVLPRTRETRGASSLFIKIGCLHEKPSVRLYEINCFVRKKRYKRGRKEKDNLLVLFTMPKGGKHLPQTAPHKSPRSYTLLRKSLWYKINVYFSVHRHRKPTFPLNEYHHHQPIV